MVGWLDKREITPYLQRVVRVASRMFSKVPINTGLAEGSKLLQLGDITPNPTEDLQGLWPVKVACTVYEALQVEWQQEERGGRVSRPCVPRAGEEEGIIAEGGQQMQVQSANRYGGG